MRTFWPNVLQSCVLRRCSTLRNSSESETVLQILRVFTKHYIHSVFTSVAGALSISASPICILAVLGPYAAIATHNGRAPLDPNNLFTIVTTLNLLNVPLNMLGEPSISQDLWWPSDVTLLPGQFLPIMAASYASLKRIQEFLLNDEKIVMPRPSDRRNTNEKEEVKDDEKDDVQKLMYADEKPGIAEEPSTDIIMETASFAWAPDADAFLEDLSLSLTEETLYMCVGPVASVSFSIGLGHHLCVLIECIRAKHFCYCLF